MCRFISLCDLCVRLLHMVTVPRKTDSLRKVTEQKSHICLLLVGRRHASHPGLTVLMVHQFLSEEDRRNANKPDLP